MREEPGRALGTAHPAFHDDIGEANGCRHNQQHGSYRQLGAGDGISLKALPRRRESQEGTRETCGKCARGGVIAARDGDQPYPGENVHQLGCGLTNEDE